MENRLKFHTKEVMHSINQTASMRMNEATNVVRNTVLVTLSGNRVGKTYRVPGTKRTYTASAPGEAPAVATSGLRQSIRTSIEAEGRTVIGKIGTPLSYGKKLELGTRKMKPRPWLRISFERALPKVKDILSRRWF